MRHARGFEFLDELFARHGLDALLRGARLRLLELVLLARSEHDELGQFGDVAPEVAARGGDGRLDVGLDPVGDRSDYHDALSLDAGVGGFEIVEGAEVEGLGRAVAGGLGSLLGLLRGSLGSLLGVLRGSLVGLGLGLLGLFPASFLFFRGVLSDGLVGGLLGVVIGGSASVGVRHADACRRAFGGGDAGDLGDVAVDFLGGVPPVDGNAGDVVPLPRALLDSGVGLSVPQANLIIRKEKLAHEALALDALLRLLDDVTGVHDRGYLYVDGERRRYAPAREKGGKDVGGAF